MLATALCRPTTEFPMPQLTTYELDGSIATITMDDGKANALSSAMLDSLGAALDRAEADGAVVILTGRPGRFSAGFDLKTFMSGLEPSVKMLKAGGEFALRLMSFPRPVVIACSGHAVAGGSFPLLAADARIGVDGPFQIGMSEVAIGMTMPYFAIELVRSRLTKNAADRTLVTAQLFSPREAVAAGYLDQVVDPDQLREASVQEATRLAALNPGAHLATKLRVREATIAALHAAAQRELDSEGIAALGIVPAG